MSTPNSLAISGLANIVVTYGTLSHDSI